MLDNIADLLLAVGLLATVFGFPTTFALTRMVPGTALGVLVGDLLFFWMALRLGRRTGRGDVTAMPLGLDTPSTIGMVLFVIGPAFQSALAERGVEGAALFAWHIGICSIFISGVFKLLCSLASGFVHRAVPRAGLLGSLTAIALVLISFIPLLDVFRFPLVGLVSLAIILTALVAHVRLPLRLPGALGALLVATVLFYLLDGLGYLAGAEWVSRETTLQWAELQAGLLPTAWTDAFRLEWLQALPETLPYLPIVLPFALATVVGGIDCTESAAAAGDEYHTPSIIAVEGFATLVAAMCGGVIQTTPYIGHPAYKAMGGRAAYTLATALFVGSAGLLGYFGFLYMVIPRAAIFSILIFIGLEITAQSFRATPTRHYAALGLACVPAMAKLVMIFAGGLIAGRSLDEFDPVTAHQLQTIQILAGGFIVTSLIWASALAAIIDRRLRRAGVFFLIAAFCSACGVMHSPLASERVFLPIDPDWGGWLGLSASFVQQWGLPELPEAAHGQTPLLVAAAYLLVSLMLIGWDKILSAELIHEADLPAEPAKRDDADPQAGE